MSRGSVTPPAKSTYALTAMLAWFDFNVPSDDDPDYHYPLYTNTPVNADLEESYIDDLTLSTHGGKTVATVSSSSDIYVDGLTGAGEHHVAVDIVSLGSTSFEFPGLSDRKGNPLAIKVGGTWYYGLAVAALSDTDHAVRQTTMPVTTGKHVITTRVNGADTFLVVDGVVCPWNAGAVLTTVPGLDAAYDWSTGMPAGLVDSAYLQGSGFNDYFASVGATTSTPDIRVYGVGYSGLLSVGQRQRVHQLMKPA